MHTPFVAALALAGAAAAGPVEKRAGTQFFGVNIAGFDFGCSTSGSCDLSQSLPPLATLNGPDGVGQMNHFVKDDQMNLFRLPVGWQYLLNNKLGANLDDTNFGKYDALVQGCLQTGATCIIDIHNYARWDGKIVGQGGPSNEQFANLWTQLALKYAPEPRLIFGLMNEPHDLDMTKWAASAQAAVTAIRNAGAKQTILLPGTDFTNAATFPKNSGPALMSVKNPDGSTTGLVFDVHKYLDSDNSGTHTECVTNNIDSAFAPLADWLRTNKRQALNTETGGGNTASCQKYLCEQIAFVNKNADVFLGYVGWSAGSFDGSYELALSPTKNGNSWTDTALLKSCIKKA
ncbi:Endoglucanase EG-II [Apiospora hydei]|uniref:cellulase n=1 Tax=Apiospora hydei TaxID=1337664 RepID=A0ABR1X3D6_9PEZI